MKRIFDIIASATLLLLLAPVFAYVAWRVRREMGSQSSSDNCGRGSKANPSR